MSRLGAGASAIVKNTQIAPPGPNPNMKGSAHQRAIVEPHGHGHHVRPILEIRVPEVLATQGVVRSESGARAMFSREYNVESPDASRRYTDLRLACRLLGA